MEQNTGTQAPSSKLLGAVLHDLRPLPMSHERSDAGTGMFHVRGHVSRAARIRRAGQAG